MDDEMIDLLAGDARLRTRLEAYAGARLTPDLATTARTRARVLALAHRQADLARADAALTIVGETSVPSAAPRRRRRGRAFLVGLLAATLAVGLAAGSAIAARPGAALYDTRLWLETLTLPSQPSQRALAELGRLEARLAEAAEALRAGDFVAASAALAAYEAILERASAAAIAAHDDIATAVIATGAGKNLAVLQALILVVPEQASDALQRAVEHAIDRSDRATHQIGPGEGPTPGAGGGSGGSGSDGQPPRATPATTSEPTPRPTRKPTPEPPDGGAGGSGGSGGQSGPTDNPANTHKPEKPSQDPG